MTSEDVKKIIKDYFKVKIDEGKGDVDFILQANKDLCTLVEKLENFGTMLLIFFYELRIKRAKWRLGTPLENAVIRRLNLQ